jgi:hypothetical protein
MRSGKWGREEYLLTRGEASDACFLRFSDSARPPLLRKLGPLSHVARRIPGTERFTVPVEQARRTAMYARSTRYAPAIAALGTVLLSGPVWADPPANVLGTWNGFSNQTQVQLVINFQASGQASGGQPCREIRGTMSNAATTISGFYCPKTGRVSFLRKVAPSDTIQAYAGSVADDAATDRMAGTFSGFIGGGCCAERPFYLTRP